MAARAPAQRSGGEGEANEGRMQKLACQPKGVRGERRGCVAAPGALRVSTSKIARTKGERSTRRTAICGLGHHPIEAWPFAAWWDGGLRYRSWRSNHFLPCFPASLLLQPRFHVLRGPADASGSEREGAWRIFFSYEPINRRLTQADQRGGPHSLHNLATQIRCSRVVVDECCQVVQRMGSTSDVYSFARDGGVVSVKLRAAMAGYFLQLWNVDCSENAKLRGEAISILAQKFGRSFENCRLDTRSWVWRESLS